MGEFKGPIVEGAYYERNDAQVVGPAKAGVGGVFSMGEDDYYADGDAYFTEGVWLTRRVYLTHTDPAEVVNKLEAEADAIGVHGSDYDNGIYAGYVNAARIAGELIGAEQVRAAVKEWVSQCPEGAEYQLKELRAKAAEVVAELRERGRVNLGTCSEESELDYAADLVAEKLVGWK